MMLWSKRIFIPFIQRSWVVIIQCHCFPLHFVDDWRGNSLLNLVLFLFTQPLPYGKTPRSLQLSGLEFLEAHKPYMGVPSPRHFISGRFANADFLSTSSTACYQFDLTTSYRREQKTATHFHHASAMGPKRKLQENESAAMPPPAKKTRTKKYPTDAPHINEPPAAAGGDSSRENTQTRRDSSYLWELERGRNRPSLAGHVRPPPDGKDVSLSSSNQVYSTLFRPAS